MGISTHVCRALFREHKFRPLTGKGLLIGRQSIHFNYEQMVAIAQAEGVTLKDIAITQDVQTRAGGGMVDADFFALFCGLDIHALDVSDYEGADIVHDMNIPIGEALHGKYDFIYDGSCMDNLFNPGVFVENCAKLLRPGGRIIHFEHGSAWPGAYLSYSPDWFFDYYCINNFADNQVLTGSFPGMRSPHHIQSNWTLYRWNPVVHGDLADHSYHIDHNHRMLIVIAEKGEDSTSHIYPIQGQYDVWDPAKKAVITKRCQRYQESLRINAYRNSMAPDWQMGRAVSNLEFIGHI